MDYIIELKSKRDRTAIPCFAVKSIVRVETISAIVKRHLQQKGVRKVDIATALGTSQQNVNNLLKKNDPSMTVVRQISEAFKIDLFQEISLAFKKEFAKELNEPSVEYGSVNRAEYVALLQENVELHRELRKCQGMLDKARQ